MEYIIISILYIILYIDRLSNKEKYRGCLFIEPISLISGLIALGTSVYQGIKGAKQKREAKRLQDEADAQEASNLSDARRMALTGLPAEQYQAALQNIYRNQSAGLGALRDRRSALAGVPALQQTTNDALMNLASQDANARRSAERVSLQQANRMSGLKGSQAANMLSSGQQMTGAALNNAFNAASYAAIANSNKDPNTIGTKGTFGTRPGGLYNRSVLGSDPISGMTKGTYNPGGIYSGLSGNTPTIPYASAY
jgi:hypothetical protein